MINSMPNLSSSPLINLIFIILLILTTSSSSIDPQFIACNTPQNCADNQPINFPFYVQNQQQPYCGFPGFNLSCNNLGHPVLQFSNNRYIIHQIFYKNHSLRVSNAAFFDANSSCVSTKFIYNLTLPNGSFRLGSETSDLFFLFGCNSSVAKKFSQKEIECVGNKSGSVLALLGDDKEFDYATRNCYNGAGAAAEVVAAPVEVDEKGNGVEEMLKRGFMLDWTASNCSVCEGSGGKCGFNESSYHFQCYCPDHPHAKHCVPEKKDKLALKLGAGIGGPVLLITIFSLGFYFIRRRYKQKYDSFLSRYTSSDHSKSDLEGGSVYFGVSIFSYSELEKATNNFDHDKELGDGGFGTVYYGKLKDGREVAVKRLYEHNYRRVEQFLNEVEILTRLRHRNLVSLYGCTSRRSRELLLVYEYIPNGTVADHLHGDRAVSGSLTWSARMNIAVETASALVYLHASEIIHRDVKTNNILLDDNFGVKVADFGLSRLFPNDVTHVSTAPQGTPGYVDPEYHQCYQLTVKSDVYSFGVVLVELISSMPAVDISRHRHEINLSNYAINKIQKGAFNELIDPNLGFESDETVRRMTVAVAMLAFKCLQQDKDMRPSMDEVSEALKKIELGNYEEGNVQAAGGDAGVSLSVLPPPSPDCDEVDLLKNMRPPHSPDSVTDKWLSSNSSITWSANH